MAKLQNDTKEILTFKVGTGKDASLYLRLKVHEGGKTKIYNVPLLTCSSIQLFTSTQKRGVHCMGSANPKSVQRGFTTFGGHIIMNIPRESISSIIRRLIKEYKPVEGDLIDLEADGTTMELADALKLQYMDQLPPSAINIFMTNPHTGKVFATTIKGVKFTKYQGSIGGNSPTPMEAYSFIAQDFDELDEVKISTKY